MRCKKAYVIRHIQFEDLGSLEAILQQNNFRITYYEAGIDDLNIIPPHEPELLIILGGPISANHEKLYPWLKTEMKVIRYRIEKKQATIGICLGAQLMAKACGGKVVTGKIKEIGWNKLQFTLAGKQHPLGILQGLNVFHWHGETFSLPATATRLASTVTYQNQAFALGAYGLGLQFHPEIIPHKLEAWYIGHVGEILPHKAVTLKKLRADTKRYGEKLLEKSSYFWTELLSYMRLI